MTQQPTYDTEISNPPITQSSFSTISRTFGLSATVFRSPAQGATSTSANST